MQQNYGSRRWGAPGGVVEIGETPMQAACREAFEETGLQVEIVRVIGMYLIQGGGWADILAHVFQATTPGNHLPIRNEEEIASLERRALTDLPAPMVHDIEAGLEDLQAGRWGVVRAVQRRGVMEPFTAL